MPWRDELKSRVFTRPDNLQTSRARPLDFALDSDFLSSSAFIRCHIKASNVHEAHILCVIVSEVQNLHAGVRYAAVAAWKNQSVWRRVDAACTSAILCFIVSEVEKECKQVNSFFTYIYSCRKMLFLRKLRVLGSQRVFRCIKATL